MDEEKKQPEEKLGWKKTIVLYLHDIAWYLAVICVLFLLVFRVVIVTGTSMNHTLLDGDYLLLLSNTFYTEPEQGDVVVISKESFQNGTAIVKRVIATEGQTGDIINGCVYVDGQVIEENYLPEGLPTYSSGGTEFPLTVEKGCVFVLGDNRGNSRDSRYPDIGQVDKREILGKALLLVMPGTNKGEFEKDYGRIGGSDRWKMNG